MEKKQENGDRGGKASGRTRKKAAKNRVGRNDRLGSGLGEKKRGRAEARKREEVAKDRVGRNDRLSLGSGGEAEKREVKTSTEAARD